MKQALAWNEDDDIGVVKSKALKIVGRVSLDELASLISSA
jgi:hypothetical protein